MTVVLKNICANFEFLPKLKSVISLILIDQGGDDVMVHSGDDRHAVLC